MEPRGQEKDTGSLPYSMGYNPPPPDRRRNEAGQGNILPTPNQTLDQNPHPQQLYTHKDSNSNSDPDPAPVSNVTTLASASYSQTAIAAAQPPPPPLAPASGANTTASTTSSLVRYRECLKNHAASMGGHAFDGCGEFMPSGEEGTPEALRCAACDCHRNFHRKESDGEAQAGTSNYHSHNHTARHNNTTHQIHTQVFRTQPHTSPVTMPPPQHQHQHQQQHKFFRSYSYGLSTSPTGPRMMAFGGNSGGAAAESSSEDLNTFQYTTAGGQAVQQAFSVSKKRIRTKFNQQQKDRMHEFAEKLGWKIQKQDEQEVQQFCNEVGVKRQVFKVWMHNNKQSLKKKER
ncbi:hypothetical protein ACH5RR_013751 [Cinchona calisaya]|uniref:ZF-HD dimerization-type domain-containing protein n=1 Tax=Cinchona calisaya TaxID=153742 RepID=A0ABD3A2B4_9GENT